MAAAPPDEAAPPAVEPDLDSSEDDEDFHPDALPSAAECLSSDSDSGSSSSEATTKKPKGRKRKQAKEEGRGLEFGSGDEATIRKGKRRRQKKAGGAAAALDEDSDDPAGEGGLIKTRAQRAREKEKQRPLASAASATVDVDALWASMNTPTTGPATASHQETSSTNRAVGASKDRDTTDKKPEDQPLEETITIHRTYTFAGQKTTESQTVPKSSAAALLYLQSQSQAQAQSHPQSTDAPASNQKPLRRPKKRASLFDPAGPGAAASVGSTKAPKLNTIEKSKLDWAGYVDKEGLKEDLDEHSKAKEGYLGRMDFLGRVERKRDEEGRRARGLGL